MVDQLPRRIPRLIDEVEDVLRGPTPPTPDIGKLSAEAVLKQFEQTSKDVEALGVTVKDWIAKLEAVLADCHSDLTLIADAAKQVQAKGDAIHTVIADATAMSKIIRDTCADFTKKVT